MTKNELRIQERRRIVKTVSRMTSADFYVGNLWLKELKQRTKRLGYVWEYVLRAAEKLSPFSSKLPRTLWRPG
jgi:hypothetical protein